MHIQEIRLVNFGPHQDFVLEPSPGLTAVTGPNGSGKSTILAAVEYAFTGACPLEGDKADQVRNDLPEGEPSFVSVIFEHDGRACSLIRRLRPLPGEPGQSLQINGDAWRSARDVSENLEALLGAPLEAWAAYCFVPQWGMASFLALQPAQRAELFGRLFGLHRVRKARESLRKLEADLTVPDRKDLIRALETDLETARAELDRCEMDLRPLADVPEDWSLTNDPRYELIKRHAEGKALTEQLAKLRQDHQLSCGKRQAAGFLVSELDSALSHAPDEEELQGTVTRIQVDLENVQRALTLRARVDALMVEEARLECEIDSCLSPEMPENYAPPPRLLLAETVRALSGEVQALEALLKAPEKGLSACPWCLSPLPDLTERRARLEEIRPRCEALYACWKVSEKHDRDVQSVTARRESLSRELAAVRSALGAMPAPESNVTADSLTYVLRKAQGQLEVLRRHKQELAKAIAERDAQLRRESELARQISSLTAILAERPSTSDEQSAMAERALAAAQSLWTKKVRLSGEGRACASRIADLASRLRIAREADVLAEKALAARSLASRGLELFHHSAVPADVVLEGVQEALEATNEVLVRFAQPFVVSCDDKMRFIAQGPRGRHSAGRLSGAQRILFGLAFRIGLLARFAPEAGLLVLDEPTAGLDEDNLGCLEVAFDALKQQAGGPLQVLMVTHESALTRLFDSAVHLKGPEGESGA